MTNSSKWIGNTWTSKTTDTFEWTKKPIMHYIKGAGPTFIRPEHGGINTGTPLMGMKTQGNFPSSIWSGEIISEYKKEVEDWTRIIDRYPSIIAVNEVDKGTVLVHRNGSAFYITNEEAPVFYRMRHKLNEVTEEQVTPELAKFMLWYGAQEVPSD